MLVSYNWLNEYVDLSEFSPKKVADDITLAGLEVEGLINDGPQIEKLVVGQVLEASKVEGSDHLNLTQVDIGQEAPQQIVCGAPNVKVGQKVIVALPGAVLPGDFEIKEAEIMGIESKGMICSLQELGFAENVIPKKYADGIYVLPDEAEVGQDPSPLIGLDDVIMDIDLTPNRADALSMRGQAYEAAAVFDKPVHIPKAVKVEEADQEIGDFMSVSVEDSQATPIYKMRLITDLEVKESPLWLQRKIMAAGMRPIDNLVDVTNYIMMEYGQPLHAFDYDAIGTDKIHVRYAKEGESLTTLDGMDRQLTSDNLVITDGEKPIGLAGVMGGENSHISDQTRTVALEAAVFDGQTIRKSAQAAGLRSEASSRYEKGINVEAVDRALDHAAALLAELGGGQVLSGVAEEVAIQAENSEVKVSIDYLDRILGTDLSKEVVIDILERLNFGYEDLGEDEVKVIVPPRRWDIHIPADVAEEVGRIYGYNNLPSTLPGGQPTEGVLTPIQKLGRKTRRILEDHGLNQAITYSLTTKEKAGLMTMRDTAATQLNWPMTEEHAVLRRSLLPGLLDSAAYNQAREMKNVALYETGRVFYAVPGENLLDEAEHVAAVIVGDFTGDKWLGDVSQVDFFTIKGVLESLLESYGLAGQISYQANNQIPELHPGRTADLLLDGERIGFLGQIHPSLAEELDLDETYVFEFSLDAINDAAKATMLAEPVPVYPGTSRDIAFIVDEEVSHSDLYQTIKEAGGQYLQSVTLFDLYQGDGIAEGKKSMAYSLRYQDPNATLVEEAVDADFEAVEAALVEKYQAEIR